MKDFFSNLHRRSGVTIEEESGSTPQESVLIHLSGTQATMDYTAVPLGLRIEGYIWTGQATTVTAVCPKCGRIGVVSVKQHDKQIIVHRGRASRFSLQGIDYCELLISANSCPELAATRS